MFAKRRKVFVMAFVLPKVSLQGCEYRGVRSGEGKNGTWYSLVFELVGGGDISQIELSIRPELYEQWRNMHVSKGMLCDLRVTAVSGRERSYVRYEGCDAVYDEDGEIIYGGR